MAQSLSKILLHLVFATKNHVPWIDSRVRGELHSYIAGACRNIGVEAFRVGGVADHVHVACSLSRTITVSKLLEGVKKSSSSWMKAQGAGYDLFSWQLGYGAFSLGQSQLQTVVNYIDGQEEHHQKKSFKEEYLEFLKRYGIGYDERYLWD